MSKTNIVINAFSQHLSQIERCNNVSVQTRWIVNEIFLLQHRIAVDLRHTPSAKYVSDIDLPQICTISQFRIGLPLKTQTHLLRFFGLQIRITVRIGLMIIATQSNS